MEQNHKNDDCYFYYYSTCTKGDNCAFRHEPSALGCEVMCSYWQQGNCLNEHCNFRHMELKKNRKSIPCYWETQRGGCKKPHCPFLHSLERPSISEANINAQKNQSDQLTTKPVNQDWSNNRPGDGKFDGSGTNTEGGRGNNEAGSYISNPAVDPLIVNFEEESDSEGISTSPIKMTRVPYCKTYEEIRLEEIQAESAAYYSYEPNDYLNINKNINSMMSSGRTTTTTSTASSISLYSRDNKNNPQIKPKNLDFGILTLDEIRKRKSDKLVNDNDKLSNKSVADNRKRQFDSINQSVNNDDGNDDKIKDIDEESDVKKCKIDEISKTNVVVPPIKLKRQFKRKIETNLTDNHKSNLINDDHNMEDVSNNLVNNSNNKIEVRLCDSSSESLKVNNHSTIITTTTATTTGNISTTITTLLNNDNEKLLNNDDLNDDDFKCIDEQLIDDEYIDTESDDILKDIDALLE